MEPVQPDRGPAGATRITPAIRGVGTDPYLPGDAAAHPTEAPGRRRQATARTGGRRMTPNGSHVLFEGTAAHTSGSREHEHVITMRRPSPGIHWRVIHLESMTQLLVMRMRGEPSGCVPPTCRSRRQASSCSAFLTCR